MNVQDRRDDPGRIRHTRQPSVRPVVMTTVFLTGAILFMTAITLIVRAVSV